MLDRSGSTRRVPDDRQRPHGGDPRADEPDRQLLHRRRAKHANAIQTFTFNGELPATDGACGVRHGPYTVGPGVRALSGFAAATINTNDVVLKLFFGGARRRCSGRHAVLAGAVPLRTGRRRASGRLLRPDLRLPGRRAVGRPADVHRHRHDRRQPGSARLLGALEGLPGHPAARDATDVPVGQPEHRHPQDVVLALGPGLRHRRRQPRLARPVGLRRRTNTTTFTTSGNNNKAATSWTTTRHRAPPHYMPTSTDPGLLVPVDERLEQPAVPAGSHGDPRRRLRRQRRGREPVRDAQPHARLLVLPRASPSRTGTPSRATSGTPRPGRRATR